MKHSRTSATSSASIGSAVSRLRSRSPFATTILIRRIRAEQCRQHRTAGLHLLSVGLRLLLAIAFTVMLLLSTMTHPALAEPGQVNLTADPSSLTLDPHNSAMIRLVLRNNSDKTIELRGSPTLAVDNGPVKVAISPSKLSPVVFSDGAPAVWDITVTAPSLLPATAVLQVSYVVFVPHGHEFQDKVFANLTVDPRSPPSASFFLVWGPDLSALGVVVVTLLAVYFGYRLTRKASRELWIRDRRHAAYSGVRAAIGAFRDEITGDYLQLLSGRSESVAAGCRSAIATAQFMSPTPPVHTSLTELAKLTDKSIRELDDFLITPKPEERKAKAQAFSGEWDAAVERFMEAAQLELDLPENVKQQLTEGNKGGSGPGRTLQPPANGTSSS